MFRDKDKYCQVCFTELKILFHVKTYCPNCYPFEKKEKPVIKSDDSNEGWLIVDWTDPVDPNNKDRK